MIVNIVQYKLPDGRQVPVTCEVPDSLEAAYNFMRDSGSRLAAEMLGTGEVSVTIEHPRKGDLDIEICSNGPNGVFPTPKQGIINILERFKKEKP